MNDFFIQYGGIIYLIQLFFAIVIGLYFWNLLNHQQSRKVLFFKEAEKESQKLKKLRSIKLTEPLASLSRPDSLDDIIGQEEGVGLLRSALCGPHPQHVIIYGPAGVGKTAAARLVLEEARSNHLSPFKENAKFVEVDATICRFDERNIADPLVGSVHDPIYQGAGAMGAAGIPQPKPGACTKAHGGILFVDEIGELHPMQMNKLLKVLEDRKVILESAYYGENDRNVPSHIHDIFQNGLPADFRLVGATTRMPDELPPALRSRCLEIFFNPLDGQAIEIITKRAAEKINLVISEEAIKQVVKYAGNGREAVNIVQLAAGITQVQGKMAISQDIIQKVINNGRFSPRIEFQVSGVPQVGIVNGLAVYGANVGTLIETEATAIPVSEGIGQWTVTGVIEEEQLGSGERRYRRKSMARGAVDNVMTVLGANFDLKIKNYDIHINFPGGVPVDGPSAGVCIATAVYSALTQTKVDNFIAMSGELSIHGKIKAVGGVMSKVEAASRSGAKKVLIPADNWLDIFANFSRLEVIPVQDLDEVFKIALVKE